MQSLIKKQSAKLGLPPGTLVHIGEQRTDHPRLYVMRYHDGDVEEYEVRTAAECAAPLAQPGVVWIDVDGVHDVDLVRELGALVGMHPLAMEDIVNTNQRPKVDDYGNLVFLVLKMLYLDEEEDEITSDQISIVLGPNFVLSFSEQIGDEFAAVRDQARQPDSRLRQLGADYLAYRLLDTVVDGYFQILELLGRQVEQLEENLLADRTHHILPNLHNLKRELLFIRANVGPLRGVTENLSAMKTPLFSDGVEYYLRDVCDHVANVMDMIETLRDMGAGNLDVYLSSISFRQNDVMRLLTIISTIFLPLTFLVGVWGMNFEFMPEIDEPWGYWASLALMAVVAGTMILWFKKKRWL